MVYSETRFERQPWWKVSWFLDGLLPALIGVSVAVFIVAAVNAVSISHPLPSSTVKIEIGDGNGSGVHIGDGLVLTAAHVASEGDVVKLKLDDGTFRDAVVVWSSAKSDVALLRTSPDGLSASALNCAPPVMGQAVIAHGSPLDVEFITTYGHIVGVAQERGPWAAAIVVDMEIIPGMSGGAVTNPQGEVVGLAVGLATLPIGLSVSATGIGMVVPAEHICGLLGRT